MMKKLSEMLLDLIYPPKCVFCRRIIEGSDYCVCDDCGKKLHYSADPVNPGKIVGVDICLSPLVYTDEVRDALLRYKFHDCLHYASTFSKIISKIIYEYSPECDIITWVPLSRKRERTRGYDQARLIAEKLSASIGVECKRLLVKKVDIPAQSGTANAEERAANVKGVYSAVSKDISGKHILLVDDIVTTGSTVSECAVTLRAAGAASVAVVTVAAAPDYQNS